MGKHNIPAVVLVGGKSSRMGTEKHLLDYGQGPQWKRMYGLLKEGFNEVYISCREDQARTFDFLPCVLDQWENIGPMGAITSSLLRLPEAHAVFVVSCDLPFFQLKLADLLIGANDITKIACCSKLKKNDFPDPLVAVWNRAALLHLKEAVSAENYSLQKLLKQHPHHVVETDREEWLFNANTKADYEKALSIIGIGNNG